MSRYRVHVSPGDVYLIPGDIHFPIHDDAAVEAMQSWFEDWFPSKHYRRGVVLHGDTIDCHSVSRHTRSADRLAAFPRLVDEAQEARPFLEWAGSQELMGLSVAGNHSKWLTAVIDNNPGLSGAPGMLLPNLLGFQDIRGVEWLPHGTWVTLGDKVGVIHGDRLPSTPASVANKFPEQLTYYGHTHRLAAHFRTTYDIGGNPSTRGAVNVGHLSRVPEYVSEPDWQTGFGAVEFFGDRGNGQPFFRVHLKNVVRMADGALDVA